MKRHVKRQETPKNWPIPRKGTPFVMRKNSKGIPITVVLRDVLKLAQNRREVKKAIHQKGLLINSKIVMDEKKSLELYDVLTNVPAKTHYRIILTEKGKYSTVEISEKEAKTKVSKIIGKKILNKGKTQINLLDGNNFYFDKECKTHDSVLIDLEKFTISKILELKAKANVLIIGGKHAGTTGQITKIIDKEKMVEIKTKDKIFNALIKQIMIIE